MATYGLDDDGRALRARMRRFIDEEVIPAEPVLGRDNAESAAAMRRLKDAAKREELWALGHPEGDRRRRRARSCPSCS